MCDFPYGGWAAPGKRTDWAALIGAVFSHTAPVSLPQPRTDTKRHATHTHYTAARLPPVPGQSLRPRDQLAAKNGYFLVPGQPPGPGFCAAAEAYAQCCWYRLGNSPRSCWYRLGKAGREVPSAPAELQAHASAALSFYSTVQLHYALPLLALHRQLLNPPPRPPSRERQRRLAGGGPRPRSPVPLRYRRCGGVGC
jgi:hypothetical protein